MRVCYYLIKRLDIYLEKGILMNLQSVVLDAGVARHPRLIVEVPPEQEKSIQSALEKLSRAQTGISLQDIVLDALRAAAEQSYFWTPEWQAKEQAAEQDILEGRTKTFAAMKDMLDFLDAQ